MNEIFENLYDMTAFSNIIYGAQNEAYMCRTAENVVRGLCFNELGVSG